MPLLRRIDPGNLELIMKRRTFLSLFLFGGLLGLFRRKLALKQEPKRALFWRKAS